MPSPSRIPVASSPGSAAAPLSARKASHEEPTPTPPKASRIPLATKPATPTGGLDLNLEDAIVAKARYANGSSQSQSASRKASVESLNTSLAARSSPSRKVSAESMATGGGRVSSSSSRGSRSRSRSRSSSPGKTWSSSSCSDVSQIPLPTSPAKSAVGTVLDHRPRLKLELAHGNNQQQQQSKIPLPKTGAHNNGTSSGGSSATQSPAAAAAAAKAPSSPVKAATAGYHSPSPTSKTFSGTTVPTVGFSLSPERVAVPSSPAVPSENASEDGDYDSSAVDQERRQRQQQKRRRQFEAFVMTGDRMIQLAKTPANMEFKSKAQKQAMQDAHRPNQLPLAEPEDDDLNQLGHNEANGSGAVVHRNPPAAKRALVRNSKSEDQLVSAAEECQFSPPDDHSGSVNTLLDTSGIEPLPLDDDSNISSPSPAAATAKAIMSSSLIARRPSPPKGLWPAPSTSSSTPHLKAHQQPFHALAPTSPEEGVDTSSLISCSEHYNADSVLGEKLASPSLHSSSSPDTPEWSLLDSFHKRNEAQQQQSPERHQVHANGHHTNGHASPQKEMAANFSHTNGQKPDPQLTPTVLVSPSSCSSNGTITPEYTPEQDLKELLQDTLSSAASSPAATPATAGVQLAAASLHSMTSHSSEEDSVSDVDSLHSYHPPAKVIDVPSAVRLAKRLFLLDGFKKTDVSRHLSRNTDYYHVVAEEYLKFFEFTSYSLDEALREFLSHFCLTGETQERERVLLYFSKRYLECNASLKPHVYQSSDAVHTLTCAIMLLNTDLHGDSVPRKMRASEFVENLSELNDGRDFPSELLRKLYISIRDKPIPWSDDNDDSVQRRESRPEAPQSVEKQPTSLTSTLSVGQGAAGGVNPFLALPDPAQSTDYKAGYVMRKSCFDSSGKRTKLGKRSWKMFFLTLRDMVLYCFKDEKTVRTPAAFEDPAHAIRVHHGLAVRATDYTKKQFVFRLHTADQAQYLFQASDEKELLTWIDVINYVVASFSSPQLPAPCSSGGKFQRPLLPSSRTRLGTQEQLLYHEKQLLQLRAEIEDHLQQPPAKSASKNEVSSYKEKMEFLRFEIMRYETYVLTLRTKNSGLE